ncbi:unnamed protein product [Scytosiphon promiscuus]
MGGKARSRTGRIHFFAAPWMIVAALSSLVGSGCKANARRCSGFVSTPIRGRQPHHQHQHLQQQQHQHQRRSGSDVAARASLSWCSPRWVTGALQCQQGQGGSFLEGPLSAEGGDATTSRWGTGTRGGGGRGVGGSCSSSSSSSLGSSTLPTLRGGGASGRGSTRLWSTATPAASAAAVAPEGISIIKPDLDVRSYRHLVLSNGLEVVLVSDPYTEQAAASMFIRAGHMQDPPELAGMAHFHEHMLFLGTEVFPEEGEFENFLTQHGGSSNAYTATESTNYYFDVKSSHLKGATDRFAQFFQTPLFAESAIERETQAVDSEHSNNKNEDSWRIYQVLKATANPSHAFSKFGSGNYETLRPRPEEGIDTRAALIKFHQKYYSADAMKLSILGNEDLDTLEAWVRDAFSGVRNTAPPAVPDYGPFPAFGEGELGRRVTVIPIKETRQLAMSWPLPPTTDPGYRRSKPTVYVSHVLGYEGEGGLHKLLHGRGWVSSLSAGSMVTGIDFQLFRLSLSLTEEGERHTDEIIELCHRFIALMRLEPPRKRIQDDLAALGEIGFRFLENGTPSRAVQNIATTLGEGEVEPEEVLSGAFTVLDWDPAAITDVIDRLTPRNCQILVVSKKDEEEASGDDSEAAGWKKERWYGTPYKVERLSEEELHRLESVPAHVEGSPEAFFLSEGNPFVPTEFGLRADAADAAARGDASAAASGDVDAASAAIAAAAGGGPDAVAEAIRGLLPPSIPALALETVPKEDWSRLLPPTLVLEGGGGSGGAAAEGEGSVNVWHKMDRSYRVPKSSIAVKLWTPEPYVSPLAAMQARIFVKLLKEDLKSWAYDASLAGLRYSLEMSTQGLQLSVGGYSSTVALLLSKILGHIAELLEEYRELGDVLESSRAGGAGGGVSSLSERQELLLQRFETSRESFSRYYRNSAQDQPYETADYYVRQVMEANVWHIDEYRQALEDDANCTPAEMARHFDRVLSKMRVDVMGHGNLGREEAEALAPAISEALLHPQPLPESELPTRHGLRLLAAGESEGGGEGSGNGVVVVDLTAATEEEKNSAVQVYLQAAPGESNLDLASALEFINTLGYTSAFQQLRTREQLGYMVYTQLERGPAGKVTPPSPTGEQVHPGGPLAWSVVVQSPDKTPAELEERVEAWIAGFREELAELSDEVFESTVASMSSSVLRRERSMREEASIFFGAIGTRTGDFYRRYRKAESYRRLTKQAVLAAFDRFFAPDAPARRKLTVRVASQRHALGAGAAGGGDGGSGDPEGTVVLKNLEDIRAFKARTPIYD